MEQVYSLTYSKAKFINNEEWRPIVGYEGIYEVSNFGRVKSLSRNFFGSETKHIKEKLLSVFFSWGYDNVNLQKNNKRKGHQVHILVASAFLKNPENKPYVNHINGIRNDNNVNNLEWVTPSQNTHHWHHKLKGKDAKILLKEKEILFIYPNEEFKDILGFDGKFKISNYGRVLSVERDLKLKDGRIRSIKEKILPFIVDKQGYYSRVLKDGDKILGIKPHKLTAEYFLERPMGNFNVRHKNGNRLDNHFLNLEWVITKVEDIEGEIWKDVIGYEGLYQVSNLGRVKRMYRVSKDKGGLRVDLEKIMAANYTKKGYLAVHLTRLKKHNSCVVHRLVAQSFIENKDNKATVNHINGIKTDNRVENLEWNTNLENIRHSFYILKRKSRKGVKYNTGRNVARYSLDGVFIDYFIDAIEASIYLKINRNQIYQCCLYYDENNNNKHYKPTCHGYIFKYMDVFSKENIEPYVAKQTISLIVSDLNNNIIGKYSSVKQAVKEIKISSSTIYRALRKDEPEFGNFKFKLIKF